LRAPGVSASEAALLRRLRRYTRDAVAARAALHLSIGLNQAFRLRLDVRLPPLLRALLALLIDFLLFLSALRSRKGPQLTSFLRA
jgi:hypothetical protein